MRIVFTGTRKGMTRAQKEQLSDLLDRLKAEREDNVFNHGNAEGADHEAAIIAISLGGWKVVEHPAGADPLARNRSMVDLVQRAGGVVVAAPEHDKEQLRSGTWMTVRYALKSVVPVIMLARGA